jgi:hypothetical protein
MVTTKCRHFWRKRRPIPQRSTVTWPGEEQTPEEAKAAPRWMSFAPFAPLCRACAGRIETRPMTDDEIEQVKQER